LFFSVINLTTEYTYTGHGKAKRFLSSFVSFIITYFLSWNILHTIRILKVQIALVCGSLLFLCCICLFSTLNVSYMLKKHLLYSEFFSNFFRIIFVRVHLLGDIASVFSPHHVLFYFVLFFLFILFFCFILTIVQFTSRHWDWETRDKNEKKNCFFRILD
jgi:hypothetical protein